MRKKKTRLGRKVRLDWVKLSIQIPKYQYDRLQVNRKENFTTMSSLIRLCIDEHFFGKS